MVLIRNNSGPEPYPMIVLAVPMISVAIAFAFAATWAVEIVAAKSHPVKMLGMRD